MKNDTPHKFPTPKNFPYDSVFYFDGRIAMMVGKYKEDQHLSLGLRWEVGESPLGYPNSFGNGMWMVIPEKLATSICQGILDNMATEEQYICSQSEFKLAISRFLPTHSL